MDGRRRKREREGDWLRTIHRSTSNKHSNSIQGQELKARGEKGREGKGVSEGETFLPTHFNFQVDFEKRRRFCILSFPFTET